MNYYYLYIGIIIFVIIFIIFIIFLWWPKYEEEIPHYKVGKFIEYSGMFKYVSNLNIGHDKDAPIFHARPYFGKNQCGGGMGEYFGVMKVKSHESIFMNFASIKNKDLYYEVNIFEYPSWEHLGETYLSPKNLSIGTSTFDNLTLNSNKEIIIIITGFMDNELMNSWLSQCKIYTNKSPKSPSELKQLTYELKSDEDCNIKNTYEKFIKEFLKQNSNYKINYEITSSQSSEESFPPTNGIVENVEYSPKNLDEILIIIIPNRKFTLNVPQASFLEFAKKRIYFTSNNQDNVDIYTYQITTLDDIYIEERFPISNKSLTLPFYVYVASPK
jgi:hypothetical protein